MNILSAFTAYPLPPGYTTGTAGRDAPRPEPVNPRPDTARAEPVSTARSVEYLPARLDEDELMRQAGTAPAADTPEPLRSFLTTANADGECRLGRFIDVQA